MESDEEEDQQRISCELQDVEFVQATTNVNVRSQPNTQCEVYFTLNHGNSLRYLGQYDEDWYKVECGNNYGYVSTKYSQIITKKALPYDVQFHVCLKYDATLFDEQGNTIMQLPVNELLDVYGEDEDYYLVGVYGRYGYVDKRLCSILRGTFIVTDKSDQATTVYVGDYPAHIYPVITAEDATSEGLFAVNKIAYNTALVDQEAGYSCPVDVYIRYHNGEGLHDACWRSSFGGEIYKYDGSHGCINLPVNVAPKVYKKVKIGTKVIVHD